MRRDSLISNAIERLIDAPFALGDTEKGWDCLNSLANFYDACGFKFPREFKDWNEQNYSQKWLEDVEEGRRIFVEFLMSLGEPVDPCYLLRGDILILEAQKMVTKETLPMIKRTVERLSKKFPALMKIAKNIYEGRQLLTFPAIYLGNGNIFIVSEKGGKVLPLKFFLRFIISARRLIK